MCVSFIEKCPFHAFHVLFLGICLLAKHIDFRFGNMHKINIHLFYYLFLVMIDFVKLWTLYAVSFSTDQKFNLSELESNSLSNLHKR